MEKLSIKLNEGSVYDKVLSNSLPDHGDLTIITKDKATESGRAGALLTFTVQLPDGTSATAQTAVTVRLLQTALKAIEGRYDVEGRTRSLN